MKKILALILALLFMLTALAACSDKGDTGNGESNSESTPTEEDVIIFQKGVF